MPCSVLLPFAWAGWACLFCASFVYLRVVKAAGELRSFPVQSGGSHCKHTSSGEAQQPSAPRSESPQDFTFHFLPAPQSLQEPGGTGGLPVIAGLLHRVTS